MKKKTARRWLNKNRWNIAKWKLGFFETSSQFSKQFFNCKRAIDNILYRKFN